MASDSFYIGIDCGTASVRAALVSSKGDLLCSHSESIDVYNPKTDYYEQSSDNIWDKTCISIKEIIKKCNIDNIVDKIGGIGVDATCSLVVLDENNEPLSISPTNNKSHNIILWMDHRAIKQTNFINSMQFDEKENVLSFVGGKISPEMEIPKILWLKQNKPNIYNKAAAFMDLSDFLTFKMTQNDVRSICTLTCKWTFRGDLLCKDDSKNENDCFYNSRNGWNDSFFINIGLNDIVKGNYKKFGLKVGNLGQSIGNGIYKQSAKEMGLKTGIAVSIGMIDAHCGAIGLLGSNDIDLLKKKDFKLYQRIALICGTSTCHMMPIQNKVFVNGIWGPYYSSLMPGLWLLEGGQSATGVLIDYVIKSFNCYDKIKGECDKENITVYQYLNNRLRKIAENENIEQKQDCIDDIVSFLARSLHVNPYFHGNRSPLANPLLEGMIIGMKLNDLIDIDQCAIYYLATLQALCYDSKFILDTIMANNINIKCVFATGGLSKNELFIKLHADITQIPIILPKYEDSVLIGASVLGLLAHKKGKMDFNEAMSIMNHAKYAVEPTNNNKLIKFHQCKYKIFKKMIDDFQQYQDIMKQYEIEDKPKKKFNKDKPKISNKGNVSGKAINVVDNLIQIIDENKRK
eukprot:330611_1